MVAERIEPLETDCKELHRTSSNQRVEVGCKKHAEAVCNKIAEADNK